MALPSVRVLKAAIAIMGVAIVLVLGAIVTLMVRKVTAQAPTLAAGPITIPPGATIEGEALDGRRVLLRLRMPDGTQKFQLVDLDGGRNLGQFEIRQDGATPQ